MITKKLIAGISGLMVLIFAISFNYYYPSSYPGITSVNKFFAVIMNVIFFLIIYQLLDNVFFSILRKNTLRAISSVILSTALLTVFLPLFVYSLNTSVFAIQYATHSEIGSGFIKNKLACSKEPLNNSLLYTKINKDTIRILCPTLKYKTVIITDELFKFI